MIKAGSSNAADYGEILVPFRGTGGNVVSLLVGLDYTYYKGQEPLSASNDVRHMYRILQRSDVTDTTVVLDYDQYSPDFPVKQQFVNFMRAAASKCRPGDWFVFFYGGHGENMPGASRWEVFGQDQAFVTPTPDGNIANPRSYLVDDEFAVALDGVVPPGVRILCLIDCCHSGTICEIDSFNYSHEIYCLSAAQDDQEAEDSGSGGVFTKALGNAITTLSAKYGGEEWSIQEMFDASEHFAKAAISSYQDINFTWKGTHPADVAWPLTTDLSSYLSVNKFNTGGFHVERVEYHGVPQQWLVGG